MHYDQLSVRARLALAFGFVLLLLLGVGGIALQHMNDMEHKLATIVEKDWMKASLANTMNNAMRGNARLALEAVASNDAARLATIRQRIDTNKRAVSEAIAALEPLLYLPAGRALLADIKAQRGAWLNGLERAMGEVAAGQRETAARTVTERGAADLDVTLAKVADFVAGKGAPWMTPAGPPRLPAAARPALDVRHALIARWAARVLAGLITRSLLGELGGEPRDIAGVAQRIAAGDFDVALEVRAGCEHSVADAMLHMLERLRAFIAAQDDMTRRHAAGEISHCVDARGFEGGYADMVARLNAVVGGHVRVQERMAETIAAYALGNFGPDMDALPGEQARISTAMAEVKTNLVAVQSEIAHLASAAAAGDFSQRGDAARFHHAFRDIVLTQNRLMEVAESGLSDVARVLAALAHGDLSARIDGEYHGLFGRLKDDTHHTVEQLHAIVQQIAALAAAAAHGDFSARADEGAYEYEFRDIIAALNRLMSVSEQGLGDIAGVLHALAAGDLTARISAHYEGTFDELKHDANTTAARLAEIVGRIHLASQTIGTASSEIADGNLDLSRRTQAEASSLEQTAAAMEELAATVKQNADNAERARQLANQANDVAHRGGAVVEQVVETMHHIASGSAHITDIVGLIDTIAHQTNLLALNAAVEAARAGTEGRGFAVVAAEVRALAQRSAAAAKDIKRLIDVSVENVASGNTLVESAGHTMREVVSAVQSVSTLLGDITTASNEQAIGLEQINKAVTQMDHSTQQNASLVEQAAAAAEALREQAAELGDAVVVFRVA
ncbi:MAG: MCP four helix bundle domain-containing protein [Proteobacteria bacterium]|nr:MCP four helix bundle domain-containing protein [Pseudomonadota bacterium]